jgi:hypothetical protein
VKKIGYRVTGITENLNQIERDTAFRMACDNVRQVLKQFLNSKFWRGLGHIFRVKTIGDIFGWWTTAGWAKAIALVIATGISWLLRAPSWRLSLTMIVGASALLLVAKAVFPRIGQPVNRNRETTGSIGDSLQSPRRANSPNLSISNGCPLAIPGWHHVSFAGVTVENVAREMETVAHAIKAHVTYHSPASGKGFGIDDAQWIVLNQRDTSQRTITQCPSISSMSDNIYVLPLICIGVDRKCHAFSRDVISQSPGRFSDYDLAYGKWEITMRLKSPNESWERTVRVSLTNNGPPVWDNA